MSDEKDPLEGITFEPLVPKAIGTKKSYFNIKESYYNLLNEIENYDGEITEDLADSLNSIEIDLEAKMKTLFYVKVEKEASIVIIKDEIDRLKSKIKSLETSVVKIKEIALDAVETFGTMPKGKTNKSLKYDDLTVFAVTKDIFKEPNDLPHVLNSGLNIISQYEFAKANNITDEVNEIYADSLMFKYTVTFENIGLNDLLELPDDFEHKTTVTLNKDNLRNRIALNKQFTEKPDLFTDMEEPLEVYGCDVVDNTYIVFK